MKKLGLFVATLFVTLGFAASAHAVVPVGPCYLHVWLVDQGAAFNNPGNPQGHGRIDNCADQDGNYLMQLQVCVQVETPSGGWATKQETCVTTPRSSGASWDAYSHPATDWVLGHTYRAWDWAWVTGSQQTYTSTPVNWQ